jgi:preprotein translocase subunit SecF
MSRLGRIGHNLYTGEVSYDFVGRQKVWYLVSAVVVVLSILGLLVRGLTLSIEFKGGTSFQYTSNGHTVSEVRDVVTGAGVSDPIVQSLGESKQIRVETVPLTQEQVTKVTKALETNLNVSSDQLSPNEVGSSWGKQITDKALQGLLIFLALVAVYLAIRYEWKMALSALAALLHDIVIAIGIYALVGFEVSPATVIGFLTILGYSLYDTVVVFDKVRENTHGLVGSSRMTYSSAANLAINQTLVRSINTSVVALLPVASLLFVGAGLLGAGSLKDLALVLFIGIIAGTYSSIFIATPLAADLKEREPAMKALAKRVAARQGRAAERTPVAATAQSSAAVGGSGPVINGEPDVSPSRYLSGRQPSRRTQAKRPGGRPSGKKKRR